MSGAEERGGGGEATVDDLGATLRPRAIVADTLIAGEPEVDEDDEEAAFERGAAIGRYLVLDRLGAGGMGVVYAAYDPELDRKVAVKVLRRSASDGLDGTTDGGSRLQREAQAMARLSHPNVIAVHDVGSIDGHVFLAMEFVDGETLTAWLARSRPAWPAIVRVFLEAGRGLEAAHAAGMIHRDFKPDNVLLSRDGRVKVSDFGLARSLDEPRGDAGAEAATTGEEPPPRLEPPSTRRDPAAAVIESSRRLSSAISSRTMPGTLLGTPSYMSPEQLVGGAADARSDLYAFSASLYEALYGRLPHTGETLGALMASVLDEPPTPPPRGVVPAHFAAIVLRGLARSPSRRYPSMAALLADLEVDPRRRRRRRTTAAIAGALTLAAIGGLFHRERALERCCEAAAAGLEDAWSQPRIDAIRGAFTALDRPFAATSLAAIEASARRTVDAWSRVAGEVCEAHLLRDEVSAEDHALQVACLDHQRARFIALVELLGRADADAVTRSIDAFAELPAPDECLDVDRVRITFAAQGSPERALAASRARDAIERGQAMLATGRTQEARTVAAEAVAAARESDFLPVIAEAERLEAEALALLDRPGAVDGFHRAIAAAIAAGHARLAARAAIDLARALVDREERHDDGRRWLDLADAWLAGDDDPTLAIDVLRARARIDRVRGEADAASERLAAARALAERAGLGGPLAVNLAIEEAELRLDRYDLAELRAQEDALLGPIRALYGADHPTLARALIAVGAAAREADALDEAEARFTEADAILRRAFGDRHRRVGEVTLELAQLSSRRGDPEGALERYQAAREIFTETLGPDHSLVATADNNIGNMNKQLERHDEAERFLLEAVEIRRRTGVRGRYAPLMNVAMTRYERAWLRLCEEDQAGARDDFEAAARYARESLAEARDEVGSEHPHVAVIRTSLGLVLAALGQDREGLEEFQAALRIHEAVLGPGSSQLAFPLLGIGRTLIHLGRAAEAIPPLERALLLPDRSGDRRVPQEIALELAMALWEGGGDRDRALRLARESHAFFIEGGAPPECESAGRWLRERGLATE
ncbi:MAG: serine/threonine-protein kinase [Nannocystaceae bacterium]